MKCTTLARMLILAASFAILAVPASSPAQTRGKAIDLARMERDLDIMEGILDKLLDATGEADFLQARTRGSYLPGLGAVFQVSVQNLPSTISIEIDKKSKGVVIQTEPGRSAGRRKDSQLKLNAILEPIIEFLGLYADAIRELPDNEHVVVIVSPRIYSNIESIFFTVRRDKRSRGFAVLARRKDIKLYRSGKLTEPIFRRRVQIVDLAPETQGRPELRIFANVLETVFGGREDRSFRLYGRVSYL